MKKVIATIALAAICFGSAAPVFASVKTTQDTTQKVKVKKKRDKVKIKKKPVMKKDTTIKN
ncbi:MAG: hypothetical protein ACHQHN_12345 [Sphingobacteriales bacterium]